MNTYIKRIVEQAKHVFSILSHRSVVAKQGRREKKQSPHLNLSQVLAALRVKASAVYLERPNARYAIFPNTTQASVSPGTKAIDRFSRCRDRERQSSNLTHIDRVGRGRTQYQGGCRVNIHAKLGQLEDFSEFAPGRAISKNGILLDSPDYSFLSFEF